MSARRRQKRRRTRQLAKWRESRVDRVLTLAEDYMLVVLREADTHRAVKRLGEQFIELMKGGPSIEAACRTRVVGHIDPEAIDGS